MKSQFILIFLLSGSALQTMAAVARDPYIAKVSIYRDQYGVPHIIGDSEPATFLGYGYAQAQDHLERMILEYRDAQGRLSEVKGPSALQPGVPEFDSHNYRWGGDYLQRLLRTWQCVADNVRKIDPDVLVILDAFARGVNYYIDEHRGALPAWIDHIRAEDIEALERSQYMRFYSSSDGLQKLDSTFPRHDTFGSNQWAISQSKSSNGHILHGATVHMPWSNQFQLYEAHLITPGKLNVGGISWFGSPFFLTGFNEYMTWSVTWNRPNIADIYEEQLNPRNPLEYLYEGAWRKVTVEEATFRIADGTHTRLETHKLYYTHHGPVVKRDLRRDRAYALKLPNFDSVNYSTGLYSIMKSRDPATFKQALARQLIPRWNFLYTDASNLYWVHNATVPLRDAGFRTDRPLPGWLRRAEWGPYLPFSSNPQVMNPRSGFLQNCNNPPWVVTRGPETPRLDVAPSYLLENVNAASGEEALNPRGERLFGVLTRTEPGFTVQDFQELALDTYILAADVFVPLLIEAAERRQPIRDTRLAHAIDLVRKWDRRSTVDSTAYPYIHYFAQEYRRLLPGLFDRFSSYRRNRINVHSRIEQYVAWWMFERGVKRLERDFGSRDPTWGEMNGVSRGRWLPLGGTADFDVLHPDRGESKQSHVYCDDGWGHIMIAMEGDSKQVWTLLPYGESEDPASPHYADQAQLHSRGILKRFWLTPAEISANSETVWGDRRRLARTYHLPDSASGSATRSRR